MANSIREKIIQNIELYAADLLIENGYQTDLGQNVERARVHQGEEELPKLTIWPDPEVVGHTRQGRHYCQMQIRLEGNMLIEQNNPSMLSEMMLADMIYFMTNRTNQDLIGGGMVESIFYTAGGTDNYPELGDKIIGCRAVFMVTYKTNIGDPYNQ